MLITRETDYAIRIMRALADGEKRTAKEISHSELVPEQFIYKILKKLEQANLIQITRGTGGGCRLTADLGAVNLYDVLSALGGDTGVNQCTMPGHECPWQKGHQEPCAVHKRLMEIQDTLNAELRLHSLGYILNGGK